MNQHVMSEVSIPNPALLPFSILVGNWNTTGTHPALPETILHGRTSFEWLANGAFLLMHSWIDEPGVPSSIAIIGSDDSTEERFMLYFDERAVARKYEITLRDNLWQVWRNAPGFFQRFTGAIVEGGTAIIGQWELSKDGLAWEKDLELTYRRVE